jgi:hypothetical protein
MNIETQRHKGAETNRSKLTDFVIQNRIFTLFENLPSRCFSTEYSPRNNRYRVSLKINVRMKDYSSANGAAISQPGATAPGMRDRKPIQGPKARDISGFQPLFIIDIPPSPSDWAGISPRRWRSVKASIASSRVEYWRVRRLHYFWGIRKSDNERLCDSATLRFL